MPRSRTSSQTQLAEQLGISQGLVSLALNGRRDLVNAETYAKIWNFAVKVGYLPKGMRRDSSPDSTHLRQVGFILRAPLRLYIPSIYFGHVQHGLHQALEKAGHHLVFLGAQDELPAAKLRQIFQPSQYVGGVVVLGEVPRHFMVDLCQQTKRVVSVSARYLGLCHSVLGNEMQALTEVVSHLVQLGHQRIGWIGGNAHLGRHDARLTAFRSSLSAAGLSLEPRYSVAQNEADRAEGGEAIHALLTHAGRKDFPTAFVSYNTGMAYGAMLALERAGWKVPRDISLASADVSRLSFEGSVRITGAGTSPDKLGEAAARLVLTAPNSEAGFSDLLLPAPLVVGTSTARVRSSRA